MKNTIYTVFAMAIVYGCGTKNPESETKEETKSAEWIDPSWVDQRVKKSKNNLSKSAAGQKLWSSIEAHGGLSQWFSKGPIAFHFDYQPLDGGVRRNSFQTVDQWSVRAVHEVADNRSWKYGWDGEKAWHLPESADVSVNPRFWSTTPYYFVGLPFVLADDGVILEEYGKKEFKGITYDLIKASFQNGIGDASGDYYVIYINPETNLMGGLRYIVSYPGFFADGGHSPEKFMEITGMEKFDGIYLSTGYNTHWFKNNEVLEHITKIDVDNISFKGNTLPKNFFDVPEVAKIQEGL